MMNIREQMKARTRGMLREEIVEVPGMDVSVLAIGLMTGGKNRLLTESMDENQKILATKLTPLALALGIHDPETREPLWNANSLDDWNEINDLPGEATAAMQQAVLRLSGIGDEAEAEGKGVSKTPDTSSSSSSPPASDEA